MNNWNPLLLTVVWGPNSLILYKCEMITFSSFLGDTLVLTQWGPWLWAPGLCRMVITPPYFSDPPLLARL